MILKLFIAWERGRKTGRKGTNVDQTPFWGQASHLIPPCNLQIIYSHLIFIEEESAKIHIVNNGNTYQHLKTTFEYDVCYIHIYY